MQLISTTNSKERDWCVKILWQARYTKRVLNTFRRWYWYAKYRQDWYFASSRILVFIRTKVIIL